MGIFQNKKDDKHKSSTDELFPAGEHFFDEYFREELRNHGRWYFEKVINENGELFKRDLQETIAQVNVDLKDHVTKQLDGALAQVNAELKDHAAQLLQNQFEAYSASLKEAQETALRTMTESAESLKQQHNELREVLQRNVTEQRDLLHGAYEENKVQIDSMKQAQSDALKWLNQSAQQLHDSYQEITTALQKRVADQENMLVESFQSNMASVIEHYLLGALGDAYDVKAQLPSIIKQMEEKKDDIVEDMKL